MKAFEVIKNEWSPYYMIMGNGFFDYFNNGELLNYTSSYIVLEARLLGLTYDEFLLYCQSKGGQLFGSKGYVNVKWGERASAQKICEELNKNFNLLIKEIKFK